jgi:transcriptional regulator with XRE-family HTH domain
MMTTLRQLREAAFLDQQELADLAGISLSTIQRIECDRSAPRRKTARRLAEVLKIDPRDIDFDADPRRPRRQRSPAMLPHRPEADIRSPTGT